MWSSYATAGIVTINFPADLADQTCLQFCIQNNTADGFRISPEFHYDTFLFVSNVAVRGIAVDNLGSFNPGYLGASDPIFPGIPSFYRTGFYIDHDGLPFGLLSLESLGEESFAESSKGGIVLIPHGFLSQPVHVDFVGPEWRDIQWVTFFNMNPGAPSGGYTQLVTFVPGPPALGLLGLGVLTLGWRSRSSKREAKC
jgi:hypothetical protein